MRVFVCFAVLIGLFITPVSADETKGPYARVASGKTPDKNVKVYTNADLEKMFNIVAGEDRETPPATTPTEEAAEEAPKKDPDPLTWLRQRQDAQREHSKAVSEARAALNAARQNLANLERQQLAARNPFSARPKLSDEEKAARQDSGESAAQRYDRTKELVEKVREEVRAAEAELARLRALRP